MNEPIYYRIMKANKHNEFYNDVRDAIAEEFIKYRDITLSKCFIQDGALYHLNRLWVPEVIYTEVICEVHDQPVCGYPGVTHTYKLMKREYYWRGMKAIIT